MARMLIAALLALFLIAPTSLGDDPKDSAKDLIVKLSGPKTAAPRTSVVGKATVKYVGTCPAKLKGYIEVYGPNNYYVRSRSESRDFNKDESETFEKKWFTPAKTGTYTVTVRITGSNECGNTYKFSKSRKLTIE